MIQIKQEELQKALQQYYTNELKDSLFSIFLFEQKYGMEFKDFKEYEASLEEEIFEMWDNHIEWEADVDYVEYLWEKIKATENANFEIVE